MSRSMFRSRALPRRSFLRGLGGSIAVGLPVLDAMLDDHGLFPRTAHAAGTPPVRLMMIHFPYGAEMSEWTPKTAGADFALPKGLAPLEKHRSKLLVLSGLANMGAVTGEGDSHEKGRLCFATAVPPSGGGKTGGGPSLDQVVAQKLGKATKVPSMSISAADLQGGTTQYVSWIAKDQYLPFDTKPSVMFDKLFMGVATGSDPAALAKAEAIRKKRKSVLDFVADDTTKLTAALGASDNRRLQAHLESVRELERRIGSDAQNMTPGTCTPPTLPAKPDDIPWQWTYSYGGPPIDRLNLLYDLMAAAFRCDVTRAITYPLWTNIGDWISQKFADDRGHHQISHDDAAKSLQQAYTARQMELLVPLLDRLAAAQEGTGTVLDNTLIYVSSEISWGGAHNYDNMPVLLLGGGGGRIKTGRHVNFAPTLEPGKNYPRDTWVDVSRLFLTILRAVGVTDVSTWGTATSPLDLSS